ncbi:hypothetical protein [Pseudomonas sp. SCB32]|uniref:hypothetical protein n=1 Tax=Pseudomonas sp. SCB32 TaxID=2653853 RepID=UPI002113B928|nr:hypothetical protein [Pseudomonas sp. SCB32]
MHSYSAASPGLDFVDDARMAFGRPAGYMTGWLYWYFWVIVVGGQFINDKIHQTLLEFFPALSGARITHRWGGALGVSRDWCPTLGIDRAKRIAWAGSYVGDGVATSNTRCSSQAT